jgi:drug/metabolite transporter (DMT)-like permease
VHFVAQHGVKLLNLPHSVYWLALIMAIFSTVLPAFLMNAGIRRIGAGSASIISSIGPIGTLVLAFLLLGETLTAAQLAGTALVLIGVYVVSRAKA